MRATFVIVSLCACGGAQYGSFVEGQAPAQAAMAADAASRLASDYPPAGRSIRIAQGGHDVFGRTLAGELRKSGYSLHASDSAAGGHDLEVRYVADRVKGTKLLRVTLYVRGLQLSRAYAEGPRGVYPAGPWSRGGR